MRGPAVLVAALLALLLALPVGGTMATLPPPPPPPTPVCGYCGGPPPPPTLVPTLAPTFIPPAAQPVEVQLSPDHVKRGQQTHINVKAGAGVPVSIEVDYQHIKTATYHGKVGNDRMFTKTWRIPRSAPPGKVNVKVKVDTSDQPYSTTFVLTIKK